ncbi:MAG: hypothetical protein JJ879_06040, partial [Sneathiella sp.]|nr:hypothetical protein [Sneathiella sp.]
MRHLSPQRFADIATELSQVLQITQLICARLTRNLDVCCFKTDIYKEFAHKMIKASMQQVRDWILKEGRLVADPLDFVNQLADRINNSGLQLDRIRIGFQTIHPQLDIWAYIWSSDTQKSEA